MLGADCINEILQLKMKFLDINRLTAFRVPRFLLGWYSATCLAFRSLCASWKKGQTWYAATRLCVARLWMFKEAKRGK